MVQNNSATFAFLKCRVQELCEKNYHPPCCTQDPPGFHQYRLVMGKKKPQDIGCEGYWCTRENGVCHAKLDMLRTDPFTDADIARLHTELHAFQEATSKKDKSPKKDKSLEKGKNATHYPKRPYKIYDTYQKAFVEIPTYTKQVIDPMSHIIIRAKGLQDDQCPNLNTIISGELPDNDDLPISFTKAIFGSPVALLKGKKQALTPEDSDSEEIEVVYCGPSKKKRVTGQGSGPNNAIVIED
ncbi:hypothetical protein H1R20_g869, partial [Candolleomyces eurysporus]